ncbi:MAG: metallophosphoesterase [Candidatus Brocadiia bacterium]
MRIFGIGDLHLSFAVDKPMDIFGEEWTDHPAKIKKNWQQEVESDDLVLIPGDLSWAMRLEEAKPDLNFIGSLPGQKYFIRGNHDFWLSGPKKVRSVLDPTLHLVRFDAHVYQGIGICGVRGWPWPGYPEYVEDNDRKHWDRALERFELSLTALSKLDWEVAVAMSHYPPLTRERRSQVCEMVSDAGINWVVYGHLHGEARQDAMEGNTGGVEYRCVSADHVGFEPALLFEHDRET